MPLSEQGDVDPQEQWMDRGIDSINAPSEEPMGEASPETAPASESGDYPAAVDEPYLQVLEARGTEITAAPIEEGLTPGLAL